MINKLFHLIVSRVFKHCKDGQAYLDTVEVSIILKHRQECFSFMVL